MHYLHHDVLPGVEHMSQFSNLSVVELMTQEINDINTFVGSAGEGIGAGSSANAAHHGENSKGDVLGNIASKNSDVVAADPTFERDRAEEIRIRNNFLKHPGELKRALLKPGRFEDIAEFYLGKCCGRFFFQCCFYLFFIA